MGLLDRKINRRTMLSHSARAAKWLDESIDVCKAMGLTIVMPTFFGRGELDMSKTAEIGYSGWIVIEAARPHGLIPDYTAHCKYLRGIPSEKG